MLQHTHGRLRPAFPQAFLGEAVWRPGLGPEGATALLWAHGTMQLLPQRLWLQGYFLQVGIRLEAGGKQRTGAASRQRCTGARLAVRRQSGRSQRTRRWQCVHQNTPAGGFVIGVCHTLVCGLCGVGWGGLAEGLGGKLVAGCRSRATPCKGTGAAGERRE